MSACALWFEQSLCFFLLLLALQFLLLDSFHCAVFDIFNLPLDPHLLLFLTDPLAMGAALAAHHGLLLLEHLLLPHLFDFLLNSLLPCHHFKIMAFLLCFRFLCGFLFFHGPVDLVIDDLLDEVAVLAFRRCC